MPRILLETWQNALAEFLGQALPGTCLLCGEDCATLLCHPCATDLPALAAGCPQCAEPTTHGERCGRCLTQPPHFDATLAAYAYAFPLDRLIHSYKYGSELALAELFGQQLGNKLHSLPFDRILPVPLHPDRLRQRGFNQALELARPISRRLQVRLDHRLLSRQRATLAQADLPHKERAANIRGAFAVHGDLSGERLLLVDDVLTTGATVSECSRVLKLHGAASVTVAVVARTVRN